MQDKIQEIMGLVDEAIESSMHAEYYRTTGRQDRANKHENDSKSTIVGIQSKLRELVREPLTEQEISIVFDTTEDESEYGTYDFGFFKDFTRNIERAHNITNTSN